MRKLALVWAVVALPGCAQSIADTCTRKFGYQIGTDAYASCFDAQTAYRQERLAIAKARGDALNKAMWGAFAIGVAGYGEAKAAQSQAAPDYVSPTVSGGVYPLRSQWIDGSQRFCRYSNGSTLNVGVSLCPASITG